MPIESDCSSEAKRKSASLLLGVPSSNTVAPHTIMEGFSQHEQRKKNESVERFLTHMLHVWNIYLH